MESGRRRHCCFWWLQSLAVTIKLYDAVGASERRQKAERARPGQPGASAFIYQMRWNKAMAALLVGNSEEEGGEAIWANF